MEYVFLLLVMMECHIVDDFRLQGILANMKQKKFWKENASDYIYRYDYICALFAHSFSWDFSIMLPIFVHMYITEKSFNILLFVIFITNFIIHAVVDDLKANRHKINLCQDQSIHFIQIVLTWCLYIFVI